MTLSSVPRPLELVLADGSRLTWRSPFVVGASGAGSTAGAGVEISAASGTGAAGSAKARAAVESSSDRAIVEMAWRIMRSSEGMRKVFFFGRFEAEG
jgi:hypothetical protein